MSAQEPAPIMQLSFGSDGNAVYKPVTGNPNSSFTVRPCGNSNGNGVVTGEGINVNMGIGGGGMSDQGKKKRGRPRKYAPDGSMSVPPLNAVMSPSLGGFSSAQQQPSQQQHPPPAQQHQQPAQQHQQLQDQLQQQQQGGVDSISGKKRGRPPGAQNKKQHQQEKHSDALGSPGIGFTPHVITVNTGEDVASKIMSFSQNGPRAICILSANGTISSVTLRQAGTSSGSVTYEGRFEILSLSGSFMLSEDVSVHNRTGGLSIALAGPDGRVIGGGVGGLLTAASPVQVVVGSFIADGRKELKIQSPTEPLFTPSRPNSVSGLPRPNSPPSNGTYSGSSDGPPSPPNQSAGVINSCPPGLSNLPWK